jgi:transcriptional regulator with XRE-family HTH domain
MATRRRTPVLAIPSAQKGASGEVLSIGAAIRNRRQELKLTLQQLADRANLSVPFLSQIERGIGSPSLSSLEAIAKALNVSLDYFISVPAPDCIVRRAGEKRPVKFYPHINYDRLSGKFPNRQMEALLSIAPVGAELPERTPDGKLTHTLTREGEVFTYVLKGTLEINFPTKTYVLHAGDSAHFDLRTTYNMRNVGDEPLEMLWIAIPTLFKD